jgi:hypothetical protein
MWVDWSGETNNWILVTDEGSEYLCSGKKTYEQACEARDKFLDNELLIDEA